MFSSKTLQGIIGEINGKPVSAKVSAEVSELNPGHFIVKTKSGVKEIFLAPSGGLSDGNLLGEIDCSVENERSRVIREHFGKINRTNNSLDTKKGMVLKAPMPGMVKAIWVEVGDTVEKQT